MGVLLWMFPALLLAGPALQLQEHLPVVTQEMVDHINSQGEWEASLDWVGDMSVSQARRMLGLFPAQEAVAEEKFGVLLNFLTTPKSFDSRKEWPDCIGAIRNQGDCGSCWAFSAVEVLADRYCISKKEHVVLSPQWLVSCDGTNSGCGGGVLPVAWKYLESHGVPLESCDPYKSGDNDESGKCDAKCDKFYKATAAKAYKHPAAIQAAIMANGPVQTGFTVYQDFMSYKKGIYVHKKGAELGGHAVKIVGWGQQKGVNYWVVANSWGTNWGMDGFFNIKWGQCGIDSDVIAGNAA